MNLKKNFYEISRIFILVIFSVSVNQFYANQGLFPAESLPHYDISYRILKGDVPLVDYWAVSGLFIDYTQSLFLFFFGQSFQAYAFHASIFNALATLLIFFFFKDKLGDNLSFFYSILFSVLAYPTSGTLYIDIHATLLSLFSIIFFLLFYKNEKKIFLFISLLLLSFSFLTKVVPAAYTSIIILFFIFIKVIFEKKFNIIIIFLTNSLILTILILIFFLFFRIPINSFVEQYFLFPLTIGKERILNNFLNISSMSIYKFIFIPIIFLFFIAYRKAKKNYKKNYLSIINICVFIFFSYVVYIHQILTMNQEFIYFLIPILFGLISSELIFNDNKKEKIKKYTLIFLCSIIVLKYYLSIIEPRKFHELKNINLKNFVPASFLDDRFKGLKWITFNYPHNPDLEIKLIKNVILDLKKINLDNSIVITNYSFISIILDKNLNAPSRWFFANNNGYPLNRNSKYYDSYQNFLKKLIKRKNIKNIYVIYDTSEDEIFRYIDKNCFLYSSHLKNIKVFTKKANCNI